jgi:hypothetical protein
MHGKGKYVVPPITREERLRLYRMHHIVEAERLMREVTPPRSRPRSHPRPSYSALLR